MQSEVNGSADTCCGRPFVADKPILTIGQVSFLSGAAVNLISTWQDKGALTCGEPPPRGYRKHGWRFSFADAIQVRVFADLARAGAPLATCGAVARKAEAVARRAGIVRDGLAHPSGAELPHLSLLIGHAADGRPAGAAVATRPPGIVVPPVFRDLVTGAPADADAVLRRAHTVVPLSAVVDDMIARAWAMIEALEAELAKPEGETSFLPEPSADAAAETLTELAGAAPEGLASVS